MRTELLIKKREEANKKYKDAKIQMTFPTEAKALLEYLNKPA
jgi:hypothetical protein